MNDAEYLFKQTEKERKRVGRGAFHKKGRGGKIVSLPSDHLTKKERDAMNGEVVTFKEKPFYTWEELKSLPDDIQLRWCNSLINRYGCSTASISTVVLNKSPRHLYLYFARKGLAQYLNSGQSGQAGQKGAKALRAAFSEWCAEQVANCIKNDKKDDIVPRVEEKAEDISDTAARIASLLGLLSGSGAKLTIEVTL